MKARTWFVVIVVLLIAALVAAGCTRALTQTPPPQESETPPVAPTATSVPPAASPTSVPQVTATPTAGPSPTPVPQMPLTLYSLKRFTVLDGWGVGSLEGDVPQGVFRTADGGETWQNATPAQESPGRLAAAYFLDLAYAWAAIQPPLPAGGNPEDQTATVYLTTDGGQTWTSGLPLSIPNASPGQLDFVDNQNGWMFVGLGVAAGSEAVEILRTTDGGFSWKTVSVTAGVLEQTTPGALPFGCDKNGIGFVNATTGWAGGFCPGTQPFFFASHDSGQTWERVTLTTPASVPSDAMTDCQCNVDPPTFTSSQDGAFVLQGYMGAQGVEAAIVYATHDGGATWTPYKLPVDHIVGSADFVDGTNGWVTDGTMLYVTHNGGQTWDEVGPMPTQNMRGSLDFLNLNDGWLTDGPSIYVTFDGGITWMTIAAVASSAESQPPGSIYAGVSIDVESGGATTTIGPDETAAVPFGDGVIYVVVHFPYPVDPEQIQVQVVEPATTIWQVQPQAQPSPDAYAFQLTGAGPGYFTVDLTQQEGLPPLQFALHVVQEGQPATPAVTLADNGKTITLQVGQQFLLDLGEGYDWTVTVADPSIVQRVVNILVIRGAQGVYTALKPGTTTLTAIGDPTCRSAQPPCAAPSIQFQVQLVVQ